MEHTRDIPGFESTGQPPRDIPGLASTWEQTRDIPGFESTGQQPRDIPAGLESTCQQPRDFHPTRLSTFFFDLHSIFSMSASFKIYALSESENELSQTVDEWVQGLVCLRGNGPDGLLARVDIAWSVVAQSHPRTPRSLRLLAVEVVCFLFLLVSDPYLPTYS